MNRMNRVNDLENSLFPDNNNNKKKKKKKKKKKTSLDNVESSKGCLTETPLTYRQAIAPSSKFNWNLLQLDIKAAYLNAPLALDKDIYQIYHHSTR